MKKSISRKALLVHPDFSKPFIIQTVANKIQLWTVICQDNKVIAFYCGKLNPAQVINTTTGRELFPL